MGRGCGERQNRVKGITVHGRCLGLGTGRGLVSSRLRRRGRWEIGAIEAWDLQVGSFLFEARAGLFEARLIEGPRERSLRRVWGDFGPGLPDAGWPRMMCLAGATWPSEAAGACHLSPGSGRKSRLRM